MKIKELIEKLREYDENMEVCVYDWEDRTYDDDIEFRVEVQSFMRWKDWKIIWSRMNKSKEEAVAIAKKYNWSNCEMKDVLVLYCDY